MSDNLPLISASRQDLLLMDPSAAQRTVLNAMEDGYRIRTVDASNPWALQIEASATTGVGIVEGYRSIEQRLYPANAQTYEDLYRHMSDEDYITAFSTPSESRLDIYLRKDEIIQYAVPYGNTGAKRLVIPRDTVIFAGDYALSFYNQINIDISKNNGIRIVWDMGRISPLHPLPSNEVQWDTRRNPEHEFIRIRIPVEQVNHTTRSQAVSVSSGYTQHIGFEDQYYYARVYHWINNNWAELVTTHSEQVYNITQPTAVIKVFEESLQVVIPTIYFTTGQIGSEVRVDVYTTRGDVTVAINEYEPGMFSGTFQDYAEEENEFITAFNNLPTKFLMAVDPLAGGANRMSFEDLRELVIMNATGPQSIPITPAQLQRTARTQGYDIVKSVDNLTNRIYLATRDINSEPTRIDGYSPLPVTMATLKSTFTELTNIGTVTISNTADRVTILPSTLYKSVNGITSVVNESERSDLMSYGQEQLIATLNNNTYLFSPYYYVLDTGENRFRTRVYDLDSPSIPLKNFVMTNPTTGVEVTAVGYSIEKTMDGYRLVLTTESNDLFKEIIEDDPDRLNCQMSFEPNDGGTRTFLNAQLVKDINDDVIVDDNGEFFIEFILLTEYDVTESNGLYLTNFSVVQGNETIAPADLTQLFDLVYIIDGIQVPNQETSDIDTLINTSFLDSLAINHVGINHDQITVKFGDHLKYLWTRSRTSVSPDQYLTYDDDIFEYYSQDVFQMTPEGTIDVVWDTVDEIFRQVILHYTNDPVIDSPTTVDTLLAASEGSTIIELSAPVFTQGHVGQHVIIENGTDIGNGRLVARIVTVINGDEIEISHPLGTDITPGTKMTFGTATVKHPEGSNVLDIDGYPISTLATRDLDRETDILCFDGAYFFASADSTVTYKNDVKNDITRWVTEDIHDLHKMLLEQTEIYYYPKQMIGEISVYTADNVLTHLSAKQSLLISLFVDTDTYKNNDLKLTIEQTLSEALDVEIRKHHISLDVMTRNLLAVVGNNVKSLRINNLFQNSEYIVTLKDSSYQFSIGKQAIGLSDGRMAVKDAVTFQFYIHDTD